MVPVYMARHTIFPRGRLLMVAPGADQHNTFDCVVLLYMSPKMLRGEGFTTMRAFRLSVLAAHGFWNKTEWSWVSLFEHFSG